MEDILIIDAMLDTLTNDMTKDLAMRCLSRLTFFDHVEIVMDTIRDPDKRNELAYCLADSTPKKEQTP